MNCYKLNLVHMGRRQRVTQTNFFRSKIQTGWFLQHKRYGSVDPVPFSFTIFYVFTTFSSDLFYTSPSVFLKGKNSKTCVSETQLPTLIVPNEDSANEKHFFGIESQCHKKEREKKRCFNEGVRRDKSRIVALSR